MMKLLMTAMTFFLLSFAALAQESVITYDLYKTRVELRKSDKNVTLDDTRLVTVDKKIRIVERPHCSDDSISCTETTVLERETVVQLNFVYENGNWQTSDDNVYDSFVVNFPVDILTQEDLETLKVNSGIWDLRGKKRKARLQLAKKLFETKLEVVKKNVLVVDERNSRFCTGDDYGWCVEDIRYKTAVIDVKHFSVIRK